MIRSQRNKRLAKSISTLAIALLVSITPSKGVNQSEPVLVLPSGTKIKVMVKYTIDFHTSQIGDEVELGIIEDVAEDEHLCITTENSIIGHIAEIRHNNFGNGAAKVVFDTLKLNGDSEVSLIASALTHGGVINVTRPDLAVAQIDSVSTYDGNTWFCPKKKQAIILFAGDRFRLELDQDLRIPTKFIKASSKAI
jgi:hypothetical protein